MKSLAELQALRDKMKGNMGIRDEDDASIRVVVGMATCGIAAGARPVLRRAHAAHALERGAQRERRRVPDGARDRGERRVRLEEEVGGQVEPPAGEVAHRRLADERREAARERRARERRP